MASKTVINWIREEVEKIEIKLEGSYVTDVRRVHMEELENTLLTVYEFAGFQEFKDHVNMLKNIAKDQDNITEFLELAKRYQK